jgi:hypothetical protein
MSATARSRRLSAWHIPLSKSSLTLSLLVVGRHYCLAPRPAGGRRRLIV